MFVVVYKFTRGKTFTNFSSFQLELRERGVFGAIFWVSPPSGRIGSLLKSERTTPPPFFPSLHLIRLEKKKGRRIISVYCLF